MIILYYYFNPNQIEFLNLKNLNTMKQQLAVIANNLTKMERYEQMERIAQNLLDMEIE